MPKLFHNLENFKDKIALIDCENQRYSYKYILEKAKYINSQIEKKSLVLIIASNKVDSIIGYISFIRSNTTSILLDDSFKIEYAKKVIKKYKPNYIFSPKGYFNEFVKSYKIWPLKDYNLIKTNFY